jgi:hypothetical protein
MKEYVRVQVCVVYIAPIKLTYILQLDGKEEKLDSSTRGTPSCFSTEWQMKPNLYWTSVDVGDTDLDSYCTTYFNRSGGTPAKLVQKNNHLYPKRAIFFPYMGILQSGGS